MAMSGASGSSPWSSRKRRSAPPTMVSTASLTVQPGTAWRIVLNVAKGNRTASNTRWASTWPLKRVRGTRPGSGGGRHPSLPDALGDLPHRRHRPADDAGHVHRLGDAVEGGAVDQLDRLRLPLADPRLGGRIGLVARIELVEAWPSSPCPTHRRSRHGGPCSPGRTSPSGTPLTSSIPRTRRSPTAAARGRADGSSGGRSGCTAAPVARPRQRELADVELEVEVAVVHPVRVVEVHRDLHELLPEGPHEVEVRLHVAEDALEGDLAAGRRRRVVDLQARRRASAWSGSPRTGTTRRDRSAGACEPPKASEPSRD